MGPNVHRSRSTSDVDYGINKIGDYGIKKSALGFDPIRFRALCVRRNDKPALTLTLPSTGNSNTITYFLFC